jgi:hypothetical protein
MPEMKKISSQRLLNQKVIDNPESSCNITGIFFLRIVLYLAAINRLKNENLVLDMAFRSS